MRTDSKRCLMSIVLLAGAPMCASTALADASLGNLTLDRYVKDGNGLEIVAHYDIDPDTLCPCPAENMRWLQLIHLTDNAGHDKTFLPEFPNAWFIDPQPGANIGPGAPADDEPWYDPTYNNDPRLPGAGASQGGAGPWLYDRPQFLNGDAPMRFDAYTLVVCIDSDTQTAKMLGGFSWGFTLTNPGPTTNLISPAVLSDTQALRDMFNLGASRLETTFDWSLVANDDPDCQFTVNVPAPGCVGALAAVGLFAAKRRRRVAV